MVDRTRLLRSEIEQIVGGDHKLVRAYEELQQAVIETLPELIEDAELSLESLDARVDVVEDALADGAVLVKDEGVGAGADTHTFNFVGDGVSVAVAAGVATVTVPGATGGAWALAGTGQTATGIYDQAVDGSKANIDFTGLGSFNELLVISRNLTDGTAGVRQLQVSVDNGSTFFTISGDYVQIPAAGNEVAVGAFAFHITNSTAARSFVAHVVNMKGAVKFCHCNATQIQTLFVASASDINAIRVSNSAGGNITGGTVRVFAR